MVGIHDGMRLVGTEAGHSTAWTDAVSLIMPEPWMKDALCAQTDPEAFFPEKGGTTVPAKSVCDACPVRAECLAYAMEHDERFGVWGGLSERERRRLKRGEVVKPHRSRSRADQHPLAGEVARLVGDEQLMDVEVGQRLGLPPNVVGRIRRALGMERAPRRRRSA